MAEQKKRNWAFVMYDDSMPDNWEEIFIESGLPVAISPHHDRDVNPTGEVKKPHYHVIVCYPGPTTYKNVKSLTDRLNATIPIPLESVRGMYRYHCHLDNPEKYQYAQAGRKLIGGFDVAAYADRTKAEVQAAVREITRIIQDGYFYEYADLVEYLYSESQAHDAEEKAAFLFEVVTTHTIFFRSYLLSRHNRKKYRPNAQDENSLEKEEGGGTTTPPRG